MSGEELVPSYRFSVLVECIRTIRPDLTLEEARSYALDALVVYRPLQGPFSHPGAPSTPV